MDEIKNGFLISISGKTWIKKFLFCSFI